MQTLSHTIPVPNSPDPPSPKGVFPPLAFSVLADQIYQLIEAHTYATVGILVQYLSRPERTIQQTVSAMVKARRLVPLNAGGHAPVYALRIPSARKPNIPHELGVITGQLALSLCEERGYGEVFPISDATKAAFLKLPVLKRPDWMHVWKRPGDQNGMELLHEYQRSLLSRNELRDKLQPYLQLPSDGKRLLIETERKEDADKYLRDLRTFTFDPQWLKRVWVTCQKEYLHDFDRYVRGIWTNLDSRTFSLVKE